MVMVGGCVCEPFWVMLRTDELVALSPVFLLATDLERAALATAMPDRGALRQPLLMGGSGQRLFSHAIAG